jgi:hypothetical protein
LLPRPASGWGDAAGDDHADAAARALGVVGGHALEAVGRFLQPGVHRPIRMRFFSRVKPRSSGVKMCG